MTLTCLLAWALLGPLAAQPATLTAARPGTQLATQPATQPAALPAARPGTLPDESPDDLPRVLFLTHSAGFSHSVVTRQPGEALSLAERALLEAAEGRYEVFPTQDCAVVTAEGLANFDAVVFYTTGELPVPAGGREALLEWVRAGGAFVGLHCATDTFYEYPPYQRMLGGVFDGHPWHQKVTLVAEDPSHPATFGLPARLGTTDEIYQFRDFTRHPLRVLLSLDGASADLDPVLDLTKGRRTDGDYAIAWARDWGQGRVFYTALGHRPELWDTGTYREHVLDGIAWALDGPDHPARAPAGATILMARGLADEPIEPDALAAAWTSRDGGAPGWRCVDGVVEVGAGTGDIVSRATFGDALIHVEFMTPPSPADVTGQGRGNSGVYVHGRYELQVLDSFGVEPLGLGDCGSIYGVKVADVDANRPPGRWQAYDIRFTAPRLGDDGERTSAARMSVWHNGLLIHDDVELPGPTGGAMGQAEAATGPLLLQDHGNRVRYRDIWIAPLDG